MLEGNLFELYLKLINVKIQREPTDLVLQTIRAALLCEKEGKNQEALKLYLRCQNDTFSQSRIEKLSPLEFETKRVNLVSASSESSQKIQLTQLMTAEEYSVFNAIIKIQKNCMLTQEAIIKETGLSQESVRHLIERLQQKGYLCKLERRYRHLKVLRHPTLQQEMVGLPREEVKDHFLNPLPRQLVFSIERRTLTVVNSSVVSTEANSKKPEDSYPKIHSV